MFSFFRRLICHWNICEIVKKNLKSLKEKTVRAMVPRRKRGLHGKRERGIKESDGKKKN